MLDFLFRLDAADAFREQQWGDINDIYSFFNRGKPYVTVMFPESDPMQLFES